MFKCIRPVGGRKIGTGEHSTHGVADVLMRTFDGAVLMGGIGTSELNLIAVMAKEASDGITFPKLSPTPVFPVRTGKPGVGLSQSRTLAGLLLSCNKHRVAFLEHNIIAFVPTCCADSSPSDEPNIILITAFRFLTGLLYYYAVAFLHGDDDYGRKQLRGADVC